jgi:hypothetical protein
MSGVITESYSFRSHKVQHFVRENRELWQIPQEFPSTDESQSYRAGKYVRIYLDFTQFCLESPIVTEGTPFA